MPAKTRYLRKLNLLELDNTDDPYCDTTASKFRDDMMLWPSVEFGNIFGYFVSRPGLYKQEQLLACKNYSRLEKEECLPPEISSQPKPEISR